MNPDFIFIAGVLLFGFGVVSLLKGFSENRLARAGAVMLVLGLGLAGWMLLRHGAAYAPSQIANVFIRAIAAALQH